METFMNNRIVSVIRMTVQRPALNMHLYLKKLFAFFHNHQGGRNLSFIYNTFLVTPSHTIPTVFHVTLSNTFLVRGNLTIIHRQGKSEDFFLFHVSFQVQHNGKKDVLLVDHLNITLRSTMNAKLSKQIFWPCHENRAHQDDFYNSPQRMSEFYFFCSPRLLAW